MALIECSGCNQKISDKALKCPKCGLERNLETNAELEVPLTCDECGALINKTDTSCANCGNPISKAADPAQQVEVTRIHLPQINKKTLRIAGIAFAALMILILGTILVVGQVKQKNAQAYAKDYLENLNLVTYGILSGAADAEDIGNLTRSVWYNSIYQVADASTNKYTRSSLGGYYDDFNIALGKLFSDENFVAMIDELKTNREVINGFMKELASPPDEYKDAYATLKDYYDAYYVLTALAINPSGSLQTFTENFNEADSEVLKYYNAMKLYID